MIVKRFRNFKWKDENFTKSWKFYEKLKIVWKLENFGKLEKFRKVVENEKYEK